MQDSRYIQFGTKITYKILETYLKYDLRYSQTLVQQDLFTENKQTIENDNFIITKYCCGDKTNTVTITAKSDQTQWDIKTPYSADFARIVSQEYGKYHKKQQDKQQNKQKLLFNLKKISTQLNKYKQINNLEQNITEDKYILTLYKQVAKLLMKELKQTHNIISRQYRDCKIYVTDNFILSFKPYIHAVCIYDKISSQEIIQLTCPYDLTNNNLSSIFTELLNSADEAVQTHNILKTIIKNTRINIINETATKADKVVKTTIQKARINIIRKTADKLVQLTK